MIGIDTPGQAEFSAHNCMSCSPEYLNSRLSHAFKTDSSASSTYMEVYNIKCFQYEINFRMILNSLNFMCGSPVPVFIILLLYVL